MSTFNKILKKYRKSSFSERDKGARFELLMQGFLQTYPVYDGQFKEVWLWNKFPFRGDLGGKDTGIDLVALTVNGEYWAIQCKCYQETSVIDKPALDSFLSTSSRSFIDESGQSIRFSQRLWISTTNRWNSEAEKTIYHQNPPFIRINLTELQLASVDWDKLDEGIFGVKARQEKKTPRPHQEKAIVSAHEYFKTADRGKLIMACGTGKTITSLKIAENETDNNGFILFLVPSISLLGQTLNEWCAQSTLTITPICICSDAEVAKGSKMDSQQNINLALPATTDVDKIIQQLHFAQNKTKIGMTVVFSTYQSIDVISKAQKKLKSISNKQCVFDLIICDEAHRTTGVKLIDAKESAFIKVHDNDFLTAKKRVYMTATPRLYNEESKTKAKNASAYLCSMDDEVLYGKEFYRIGFGEAVEKHLLSDYKVLILTIGNDQIPGSLQSAIADKNTEINTDDASKLIGCINALSKRMITESNLLKEIDPEPMRRAVAFCPNIKASKKTANIFNEHKDAYYESLSAKNRAAVVAVEAQHVDGTMGAATRDEKLTWLKEAPTDGNECRILTNVRCLSEGVDVPSLDAVLFLSARNSQVDVVQSVGRVMRVAHSKKYGYIIIPVIVPSDAKPEEALDHNVDFSVVWSVLNALRAHDDRFNAMVNKIELNKNKAINGQVLIGGTPFDYGQGNDESIGNGDNSFVFHEAPRQYALYFDELQGAIYARMVEKVGNKRYWEQWAKDIAEIAQRHKNRILSLIEEDGNHRDAFYKFMQGIHKNINPYIKEDEAVDMLAQHMITQPVFESLFENYSFVKNNPISQSMQHILDLLEEQSFEKDRETLTKFYESVKQRCEGVDNAEGKQKIIIELYDKFFKTALQKTVEKLGIVYTPVEVVDFIINSVNDILKKEFNRCISDENIHILDPFTGTGTFITRLLQSGLIKPEDLLRKYMKELHSNEIVLLAYYIASINIENVFHDICQGDDYTPFEGICLTDTFQLGETDDGKKLFSEMFPKNSERVIAQKKAPLRVIIGNPPYSVGQKSANDNAQNENYARLDKRIADTYAKNSTANLNKFLYDSYVRAFRWSSDRLDKENGGIIAFISNAGWLDGPSMDGFRKCLEHEFTSIYVFNLRGGIRGKNKENSRKEGQNIFNIITGVSIIILVKNPKIIQKNAEIFYYDVGEYLTRKEKLEMVSKIKSISNNKFPVTILKPNQYGDWLNQRNNIFGTYIAVAPEKKFDVLSKSFFVTNAIGVSTNRDTWVYNYSEKSLQKNMNETIDFYNQQCQAYHKAMRSKSCDTVDDFIDQDKKKISWTANLKKSLVNNKIALYDENAIIQSMYRPFSKTNLYFNSQFIERPGLFSQIYPTQCHENLLICIPGIGDRKGFSTLITKYTLSLDAFEKSQCFPLYYYEKIDVSEQNLFSAGENRYIRHDGITDFILTQAQLMYGPKIIKEDIFYYVYGLFHLPEYRKQFSTDLKKMLPRIPLVEEPNHFWSFSKAGRAFADIHLNYETQPHSKEVIVEGAHRNEFTVQKMKFINKDDKSTIIYNSNICISNIPPKAYEYIVNGKSAIEWVIERYQITVNKDSGIENNPNDWAKEHNQPRYILDLLLSIINVSVETMKIVESLPDVKFE